MDIQPTKLPDVVVIQPRILEDERGFFFEAFNAGRIEEFLGTGLQWVQDNHSRSVKGVLRGLHYQLAPKAQGKLVRVVRGSVLDVAVDVRRSSPTFGEWVVAELSEYNHKQLWVPPGFAHGFLTLSEEADVLYKATEYYSLEHDRGVRWDDPDIGIAWPDLGEGPILSPKDSDAPFLKDAKVFE